jgi:hypothetical protein
MSKQPEDGGLAVLPSAAGVAENNPAVIECVAEDRFVVPEASYPAWLSGPGQGRICCK